MDSNASYAGEVERNVSRDNDFSLRGKLHQKYQLVLGQSYRTRRSSKMSCSRRPSTPRVEGRGSCRRSTPVSSGKGS